MTAHAAYVGEAAAYYIDTRLRSSPEEQQKYCKPLGAMRLVADRRRAAKPAPRL